MGVLSKNNYKDGYINAYSHDINDPLISSLIFVLMMQWILRDDDDSGYNGEDEGNYLMS